MEFHKWLVGRLSDHEYAETFYETVKEEFLKEKFLPALSDSIDAIIEAQNGSKTMLMYEVYFTRGMINYHSKRYSDAIEDYTMALKSKPEDTQAMMCRDLAYHCMTSEGSVI